MCNSSQMILLGLVKRVGFDWSKLWEACLGGKSCRVISKKTDCAFMSFMKRCYCFCFSLGLLWSIAMAVHSILNSFKMTLLSLSSPHIIKIMFNVSSIYFLINSLWYLFLLSVLGTFAATYLTVAIIVKYHTRPVHEINLSPLYSSGWVWSDNAFKFSLPASSEPSFPLSVPKQDLLSCWKNVVERM